MNITKLKKGNGIYPLSDLDRSRNKLNLSHDDLDRIFDIAQTNETMASAINQLLMIRKLVDDGIVKDEFCYPTTWSVHKSIWMAYFDDLIDGSNSVAGALSDTFAHFYQTYEETEHDLFEPLTENERKRYYVWFAELQEDDPDFEFDDTDLDQVTE